MMNKHVIHTAKYKHHTLNIENTRHTK